MKPGEKISNNKGVRFITATTIFDGHDASINIIRQLLQNAGAEVIHLGYNRSAKEIVHAAIQEGVHAIAASSYQGGHMEFYKYIKDLLKENNAEHICIFGGGGGVIIPDEIRELEKYGITKIYSPEDGQKKGLTGIIDDMMQRALKVPAPALPDDWKNRTAKRDSLTLSSLITLAEMNLKEGRGDFLSLADEIDSMIKKSPVIGITGTGGSGKSSLIDETIRRFLNFYPDRTAAILAFDPTRKRTGGALLGDRIRMNFLEPERIYMRSLSTGDSESELPETAGAAVKILQSAGFDLIIIETPGIGQGDNAIVKYSDISIYVMTAEYGSPIQLEKIDMLDFADLVIVNKFDRKNSIDALRHIQKQYRRNHNLFEVKDEDLPVIGTVASNFEDQGLLVFFERLISDIKKKCCVKWKKSEDAPKIRSSAVGPVIPPGRENYLWEISETVSAYHKKTEDSLEKVGKIQALTRLEGEFKKQELKEKIEKFEAEVDPEIAGLLSQWENIRKQFSGDEISYTVRGREITRGLYSESLSGLKIPRIVLPDFEEATETLRWLRREHLPGYFPFTAGVFNFRREGEEPRRQFAGEGPPERTNKRFHFLTRDDAAKRLSTAFDSITLYGEDPSKEPDIFGKIGESGVSICSIEDVKKLYDGFDLCSPETSVSMTINGPAPIMLAFFFNTAIDQQVEKFKKEHKRNPDKNEQKKIEKHVLNNIRGTVQADILKEDQGQNTCIFPIGFALRMMGDIQEYFIKKNVGNFYSVSISGYHIAEAGANPITQLALTLSNAFTYVEYYLGRGMDVNEFAPNLSFFFSSGMEPEHNVIIRVARRIWAIAMKYKYGADEQSQRLKCHVQTSGRSLHAQEIQFNDIRTTLQALMALNDNCNSLHTNSYDEAITTPTEESVRRAVAIQHIISKEYGFFKNQNPLQGSFIINRLTDMVETEVLQLFEAISRRGGVLGAMETHFQRGRIQDESLFYEQKKYSGEYPIIGVNTFINPSALADDYTRPSTKLTRTTLEEKMLQIKNLEGFKQKNQEKSEVALRALKKTARSGGNIFEELLRTTRVASLGQITHALYEVGGKYRRNM